MVLGGDWGFMTGDLEDGVIFDIIDHDCRWYSRQPESLMKIGHDLAEKGEVGLGGCWLFLTGDLEDGVIFDIIDHVGRWYGSLMKVRDDLHPA